MAQLGRRIIFDKVTGRIIADLGEFESETILSREHIGGLDFIDLPYGLYADSFAKVKAYHIDITTRTIVFDELDTNLTKDEQIAKLQQELLIAQGVI